jgi:hypothetical protein
LEKTSSHVEDLNGRRSDDNYVPHLGSFDELNWFQTRRVRNTALTLCASDVQGREDGRKEKEMGLLAQAKSDSATF